MPRPTARGLRLATVRGVTIAAPLVERDALPRWVKARLTATGFDASREVIELICERCEGNPARSEAGNRKNSPWSSPANWMWTMSSALWLTWRAMT